MITYTIHYSIHGGEHGVIVITVENGLGDWSSNSGWSCLQFPSH